MWAAKKPIYIRKERKAMTHPICPECSTIFVKRAQRESLQERVLSLICVYPFRCQLCRHRFRFLHQGIKYLRVEEDRRAYERLAINFPVTFTSDSIESKGSVADISIAGCAMQAEVKMDPGAILRMSLQMSDGVPAVAVQAAVVRDVRRNRIGVEFLQLKKTERDRLRDFIRNLLLGRQTSEAAGLTSDRTAQFAKHCLRRQHRSLFLEHLVCDAC